MEEEFKFFLIARGHLNNTQHGFRRGLFPSAFLCVFGDMWHMHDCDSFINMVYFAYFKRYSTRLIMAFCSNKLKYFCITGELVTVLTLCEPGGTSQDSKVLSEVPPGTVLGTLLFLIMISFINKHISSSVLYMTPVCISTSLKLKPVIIFNMI